MIGRHMCICKWGGGVGGLVVKGVRKGSRDEYIGKSGVGGEGLGLVGVGGLGVGGSGVGGSGVGGLFCRESEARLYRVMSAEWLGDLRA